VRRIVDVAVETATHKANSTATALTGLWNFGADGFVVSMLDDLI